MAENHNTLNGVNELNGAPDKIDKIKDILFGANIAEYNKEFADVYSKIAELENKNEQQFKKLEAELNSNFNKLEKKLDKLIETTNTNKTSLSSTIKEVEKASKANLKEAQKSLEKDLKELRKDAVLKKELVDQFIELTSKLKR